ncbi:hypothetical protein ICE98_03616 [Lactococcus lactis]|nr:hypothetical protein [Lactococcus lactis]
MVLRRNFFRGHRNIFCSLGIAALFSNAVSSTDTLSTATSPNMQYVAKAQFADGGGFGSGPYTVKVTTKKHCFRFLIQNCLQHL